MIHKSENPSRWFHTIRPGLQAAIRKSGGYISIGEILMRVAGGEWELYIVERDEDYIGFAIVEYLALANGMWLNIPFAYAQGDAVEDFLEYASHVAADGGMAGVKFISSRPGFERVAKAHGWKRGFQEFIVADYTQGE